MAPNDQQTTWYVPQGGLFVLRIVSICVFAILLGAAALMAPPLGFALKWGFVFVVSYLLAFGCLSLICSAVEMKLSADHLTVHTRFKSYSLQLSDIKRICFLRLGPNVLGGELWMTVIPGTKRLLPIRMIHIQYMTESEKRLAVDFVETLRSAVELRRRGQEV